MILHPNEARLLKRDVPKGVNKLFDAALKGFEGVGETVNSKGISMLLSLKRIPGTDWIIGAQQPQKEAFAPLQEAQQQIFYSVITAVILSILIGAIAIRGITKPLLKLRRATILFGEAGDTHADDPEKKQAYKRELESIKGGSEIGELAEVFGQISRKLDQTIGSLKAAARDWELTFDSVSDGILIVDNENRLLRLNRTAAEYFNITRQINNIVIDLDQDFWAYISRDLYQEQTKAGEVGSSTMPHKVNPINFENSEGNLMLSNSLLTMLSDKLCRSRMQRDLSDSTVERNMGVALAHSYLALTETLRGLKKVRLNNAKCRAELEHSPELLAEPIQTILRPAIQDDPYTLLKQLSRGKAITQADIEQFVEQLDVDNHVKTRLQKLQVMSYVGDAVKICDRVLAEAKTVLG